jgi:hypothetical protein
MILTGPDTVFTKLPFLTTGFGQTRNARETLPDLIP